jgi:hypothetical protein
MNCLNCNIEFEGRTDAKFCSPKCRVTFNRKQSTVTDNVTFKDLDVTDNFKFYTIANARPNTNPPEPETKSEVRQAKYWYNVPLGAIPVMQKDWPKMPEWMNGRQYFLWWKNEFKENDGVPEILNPYPNREGAVYIQAGEGSRRWGV